MSEFLAGIALGLVIGAYTLMLVTTAKGHHWDYEIVEKGCADYNITTGDFQWRNK